MSKKFKQILEGKHRNHTISEMGDSTAYVIIHEIDTNKLLTPAEKVSLIEGFCQNAITVQGIADKLKSETADDQF